MKRVCKRTVIIDALTVCCQVENNILLDKIAALEFGEVMDFYEFQLVRVDGRYFKNIYSIHYYEQGEEKTFGQLKFGLNNGSLENNTFESGKPKAWLTLSNRGLYESDLYYMGFICEELHLNVHYYTSVDLALDTPFDVSRTLYRTEVHLNNDEIRDYLQKRNIDLNPYMMDWSVLEDMFFLHLNSLIRFERGREKILWEDLLGRR